MKEKKTEKVKPMIERAESAYQQVRQELCEFGLLADGEYLDDVSLCLSPLRQNYPMVKAEGWFYENKPPIWERLVGFREGVIYLSTQNAESTLNQAYTLTDVVRHEFAHAWYWFDSDYVDGVWFEKAFAEPYNSDVRELESQIWEDYEGHPDEFRRSGYAKNFVSPYAMYSSYEDFAETFAWLLRNRRTVAKLRNRSGAYRKVRAVQEAVKRKAKMLELD